MTSALMRKRSALIATCALALFVGLATVAAAATAVQVAAGPFKITPRTYWASVKVSCPAGETPCNGTLSLETAHAIAPYAGRPKAKAKVADVAYSIPAGTTQAIKTRVYGPALAQAIKAHSVAIRLTAWESGNTTPVARRVAVFTLAHR